MPLMLSDITSVQTQQTAALDQQGRLSPVMRMSFKVRGQGPFFVEIPAAQWTADVAQKEMERVAAQVVLLLDKYPG